MKLVIASDHAGYDLKEFLKVNIKNVEEWTDCGTYSSESVDYPDFAHKLASIVSANPEQKAILICGSGNGVAITANKHPHVRAALCWCEDIASLAVQHNNANVLVLPARFISQEKALKIVTAFFSASFEGGRHQKRVEKINL